MKSDLKFQQPPKTWLGESILVTIFCCLPFGIAGIVNASKVESRFYAGEIHFFPKCPFWAITGLKCPGCGSQRAVHHLLNLEVLSAAKENILLVLSIPYILAGLIIERLKNPSEKLLVWRKRLYGRTAIYIILAIIIAFWIMRNI
ncbi:DUF2752 domain-containing protein [Xiashengella succiniciproducens]|uniref:DUF2752 domain-containing protein n=1 Tax=Xiashengella succiniciproducens TaxID=2949635 RepID=UPI003AF32E21